MKIVCSKDSLSLTCFNRMDLPRELEIRTNFVRIFFAPKSHDRKSSFLFPFGTIKKDAAIGWQRRIDSQSRIKSHTILFLVCADPFSYFPERIVTVFRRKHIDIGKQIIECRDGVYRNAVFFTDFLDC